MPDEGVSFVARDRLLDVESILSIARVAHGFGVRHFKLTGGEPTLRPDLVEVPLLEKRRDPLQGPAYETAAGWRVLRDRSCELLRLTAAVQTHGGAPTHGAGRNEVILAS